MSDDLSIWEMATQMGFDTLPGAAVELVNPDPYAFQYDDPEAVSVERVDAETGEVSLYDHATGDGDRATVADLYGRWLAGDFEIQRQVWAVVERPD